MRRPHLAAIVCRVAVAGALAVTPAAGAQYGDLAPGAAMSWSLSGVHAEVGVRFAMDPAFVARRLPAGFRAYTLGGLARSGDSVATSILAARPALASHVLAVLAFARLDSTIVEGDTTPARPLTLAFWWVFAGPVDPAGALPDPRARAGQHNIQLGLWSADPRFGERLGAVIPTTVAAPVTVTADGTGGWRLRLTTAEVRIVGSCHPVEAPVALQFSLPAFSTVWAADTVAGSFTVFTYYGNRVQPCRASWQANGDGPLARALRTGVILGTDNQTGWRAKAAAYAARRSGR